MLKVMRIVIAHYHMQPGGVTTVISDQVTILLNRKDVEQITLVSGRPDNMERMINKIKTDVAPELRGKLDFMVIPEFDYHMDKELDSWKNLKTRCKEQISKLAQNSNLLWFHNYHIGKNPALTAALLESFKERSDTHFFLHIHDFPEAGRFGNLELLRQHLGPQLYDFNKNVVYGVINHQDYRRMIKGGLREEQLILMPNPVSQSPLESSDPEKNRALLTNLAGDFPGIAPSKPYLVYPVRAIRRKNVFEAILLSLLLEDWNILITLPGTSEKEAPYSLESERFLKTESFQAATSVGLTLDQAGLSFSQFLSGAQGIISTSVQEGFGYLFLNSQNWGKPLLARNLGILEGWEDCFSPQETVFYQKLWVPLMDEDIQHLTKAYSRKLGTVGPFLSMVVIERLIKEIGDLEGDGWVDFSLLSVDLQKKVLLDLRDRPVLRQKTIQKNKTLLNQFKGIFSKPVDPGENIGNIEKNFGVEAVNTAYQRLLYLMDNLKEDGSEKRAQLLSPILTNESTNLETIRLLFDYS